jgi:hypothetical protein
MLGSQVGSGMVAVPPFSVITWETYGVLATGTETVCPYELTMATVSTLDGM